MATPPQDLLDPILLECATTNATQLKRVLRSLKGDRAAQVRAGLAVGEVAPKPDADEPRYQYSTLAEGGYRLAPLPEPEETWSFYLRKAIEEVEDQDPPEPEEQSDARASTTTTERAGDGGDRDGQGRPSRRRNLAQEFDLVNPTPPTGG